MLETLRVENLKCVRDAQLIFNHLSFDLAPGEMLLVEGANGSGKSSLLRIIAGLASATDGTVFWQTKPIEKIIASYWEQLHYVGHSNGIKLGLTVKENLALTQRLANTQLNDKEIISILTQLQLNLQANALACHLSAGQKRRLALAKLFIFPRKLWILDEPLTALDQATQTFLIQAFETHLNGQGMIILSSHQSLMLNKPIKRLRLPI